ncbi:MAG TPA: dTMP kinase [Burkholderiales bacterium]|nr:dTMP kinase [Burkholderiales bacterium]
MAGLFITVEGIDGAGKSTHLQWLVEYFEGRERLVTATREPGGTPVGEALRRLLLDSEHQIHAETEALLMFAARREHLDRVILPALAAGRVVLCDRFTDATFAYQGWGRGVSLARLEILEQWVQGGLQPDLTLFFDVPVEVGHRRMDRGRAPDRFERQPGDFFERARSGYLDRAAHYPTRFRVIDSTRSIGEIHKTLEDILVPY